MDLPQPISVKELATTYNAKLIGSEINTVGSVNEINRLKNDSLTFVDHIKYFKKVLNSKAIVILINKEVECPEGKTLLVVDNPFEVYNAIAENARPFISSKSMIAETATIGENTIIQPNVFIGEHVKIGKNCTIHPNVSIYNYSEIGDNVIIHSNTVIGNDAFYYNKQGEDFKKMHTIGKTVIKDNVEIGSSCTISAGVSSETTIGEGTKIDCQVHVAHGTVVGRHCLFAAQVAIAGKCYIGDNVILYGKVGVSKGVSIGKNAVLLASSNVDKSIPGNETYYGSPAIKARDKWKEMVYTRMLPKVWKDLLFKSSFKKPTHKTTPNKDEFLA